MANRMKEDEKNEKIIRGLLKLPANRKCINCNSLGPQYVCTNFWTFICTTCSGIHREFTHRVKSVSMAKFSSQEVSALQAGGNERAKEIYLKEWDSQRHSLPDSSNVERLRDFIKHVYVDRRYTGERSSDRPPRVQGERDDYNDNSNRRADAYRGGSRSPPYEDTFERRYNERPSPGGRSDDRNFRYNYDERRSPGYDQEVRRYGDYRRSPGRFDAVEDRNRDDRYGNGNMNRRSEENRSADMASKPDVRSPDHQKDMSSPPMVRPVREILGEDVPPLRVGEPPKANGSKAADVPAHAQRTASSSSMGSTDGNPVELKRVNSGTLIDFSADPEPPKTAPANHLFAAPPVQQPKPMTAPPVADGNWASFDFAAQEKAPQPPSSANTLESALFQLAPASTPVSIKPTMPVGGVDSFVNNSAGGQWPAMQLQQPSLFTAVDARSAPQQYAPVGVPSNQPWGSFAPSAQGPLTAQQSQHAPKVPQEISSGVPSQPPPVEAKASGRKELPADLFTATYSPAPVPVPGWQTGQPRGMGLFHQYPSAVVMPTFFQPPKSTNPFDLTNEPTLVHASSFPSMASLQGALPSMGAPPTVMRSSSFGTPSQQWAPPQVPSYPTPIPSNAYMMQQASNVVLPLGHQGAGGFGNEGSIFSNFGSDQHLGPRYPQPSTPNSFPSGGNPFG